MPTDLELLELHRHALHGARHVLTNVHGPADLDRPTPCADWDLGALSAHLLGQNHGFALALAHGDAPADAYAPRPVTAGSLLSGWDESVNALLAALAAPAEGVRLAEVAPDALLPLAAVVRIHLLDTAVHTWDVATSLGLEHRPADAVLDLVAETARGVPAGASRTGAGAAFAPPVDGTGQDPWADTLARLGRRPVG